jgi:Icc-related predicted phosphoesterase
MKAWIVSDIHLTRMPGMITSAPFPVPDADVCIVAGDTSGTLSTAIDFLLTDIEPIMPVVMTLGNHEYVGLSIEKAIARTRRRVEGTGIHFLENDTCVMGDVRFIGATLWTDFALEVGDEAELPRDLRVEVAKLEMKNHIADYTEILSSEGNSYLLTPDETIRRHFESRAYFEQELRKPFNGRTVVVSHHAPLPQSIDNRFASSVSNAAYASDLSDLIDACGPDFWMHGHVHQPFDYRRARTRFICNPRGFSNERERNGFIPDLVIDI